MERDEDVEVVERGGGDVTGRKAQVRGESVVAGEVVAESDQLGTEFDAGDLGARAQMGGERESEVALARTHVGDAEGVSVES